MPTSMNWGMWLQGLASAFANSIYIAIAAMIVLSTPPKGWQLFVIAVGPFGINFFSYIKQNPPPFGYKNVLVRDHTIPDGPKVTASAVPDAQKAPKPYTLDDMMKGVKKP